MKTLEQFIIGFRYYHAAPTEERRHAAVEALRRWIRTRVAYERCDKQSKRLIEEILSAIAFYQSALRRQEKTRKVISLEEQYIHIRSLGHALCAIISPDEVCLYDSRLGS